MKKLDPLEADHTKLKAISQAAKSAFGCEMVSFSLRNFAAILHACEILLSASRYLRPTFLDLFLQIFDV